MLIIQDNFVQPVPEWLIDPVLKLRMIARAPRESYSFDEANLIITYDPEIRPDRLTQPPSTETRARRLAIPSLTHLADKIEIFESDKTERVTNITLKWEKPTDVLRLKVPYERKNLELWARGIIRRNIPFISDHALEVLLYCIRSAVKFDHLRDDRITEQCPQVRRLEIAVMTEVARDLYGLPPSDLNEVEPGWVCIASREIDQ